VAWKDLADFCEKYLKKGKSVYVTGELQVRSWDDKTSGQKRYITEIKADRIEFADSGESKPGGQQRQSTAQPRQQAAPQARATSQADDAFDDGSEIPF